MPDDLHGDALWEVSLYIFQVCVSRTSSQMLKSEEMIEGAHLILNSVLLIYKGGPQQGFALFMGFFRGITPLHWHCPHRPQVKIKYQ